MTKTEALARLWRVGFPSGQVMNQQSYDRLLVEKLIALGFIEEDLTDPLADLASQLDQLQH